MQSTNIRSSLPRADVSLTLQSIHRTTSEALNTHRDARRTNSPAMASLNEKTSASASPIPTKPLSASLKGAGGPKQPQPPLTNINSRHLFRDNFSVGTWLLLGASFQAILLLLPIRPSYAISPGLLMLGYRFVYGLGQIFGVVAYDGMRDVVPGKTAASYPETYDVNGQRVASDRGICVIMLFSRCNQ